MVNDILQEYLLTRDQWQYVVFGPKPASAEDRLARTTLANRIRGLEALLTAEDIPELIRYLEEPALSIVVARLLAKSAYKPATVTEPDLPWTT